MEQLNSFDETLIDNCVLGQVEAWEAFAEKYAGLIEQTVLFTLRRFGVNDNLVDLKEEISQEIFVSLQENDNHRLRLYHSKNGGSFASWLRVVSGRLVIDYLRRTKGSVPAGFTRCSADDERVDPGPVCNAPLPDEQLDNDRMMAFVRKTISRMPAKDRLIFKLVYEDGLSIEETSKIVRLSPGGIYTRISRIKGKIRDFARKEKIL